MQQIFPGLSSQVSVEGVTGALLDDRSLWLGIGCNRGVSIALIAHAVETTLHHHHLRMAAIAAITTLDRKAGEVGLVEFCLYHHLPLYTFVATVLNAVAVPQPSTRLLAQVGVFSVAEACAIQGCETWGGGCHCLCVPKTVVRLIDEPGAVTIAIAQARHAFSSSVLA